jgi:outer membrane protein assembly factor BamE (lipoprotein component of BamABCDE complex)
MIARLTYILLFLLSGCENFPYMPDVEQGTPINTEAFKKIHPGDDEHTVLTALGHPSFKHLHHNNQWYYMIENSHRRKPLVYKLVFNDHKLASINTNQSV